MLTIDYIILAAFLISVIVGVFRGLVREALSLVTWIVALWVALNYSHLLEAMLGAIASPGLRLWSARLLMFLLVLIAGGLLNSLISILIKKSGLTGTDRVLGMVFGAARGMLVVGIIVMIFQLMELDGEPWWEESRLVAVGEPLADWLQDHFRQGIERLDEVVTPALERAVPVGSG
jgi:membrane protein required for colicin V production